MLGRALTSLGDVSLAEEELALSADLNVDRPDLAVEALLEASLISIYTSGPIRSLHFASQARRLLSPASDHQISAWISAVHGLVRLTLGDPEGAAEIEGSLVDLPIGTAVRGLRGVTEWGPRLNHLQAQKSLEMFETALADYRIATELATPAITPMARSVYDVAHADTLFRMGRLSEAKQILLRSLESTAFAPLRAVWAWVGLGNVCLELGEPAEARQYCDRIEDLLENRNDSLPVLRLWLWRVQSALLLDVGDAEAASNLMTRAETLSQRVGVIDPGIVLWHPQAVSAHLAAGRYAEAERVLGGLEASANRLPTRWPRAVACRGRALLAELAGDMDQADSWFQKALGWHRDLAMRLEEAETLLAYGGFLRRHRSPAAAREILGRAIQLAAGCGADRLETRASGELRSAGGRRRTRGSHDCLTPLDERIARLAAGGMTNVEIGRQLFISARTVEHHLSHIYSCLEVSSRRQLQNRIERIGRPGDDAEVLQGGDGPPDCES